MLYVALLAFVLVGCQESLEERAAREARELTEKKCPMPMRDAPNLFLDSLVFDQSTLTLHHYYSLLLDTLVTIADYEGGRQALLQELKSTPNYQPYREHGFNFHYLYRIKSDPSFIFFETTLRKEDYK